MRFPKKERSSKFKRVGETKVRKYFCLFSIINNQYVICEWVYKRYTLKHFENYSALLGFYSDVGWFGEYISKTIYEYEKRNKREKV